MSALFSKVKSPLPQCKFHWYIDARAQAKMANCSSLFTPPFWIWSEENWVRIKTRARKQHRAPTLHMVAAPAVQAAVKTELSYGNETIIAFFLAADKNKGNAKVALASSNI